jgi:sialidase-1
VLPADRPGVYEAILGQLKDGRFWLLFVEDGKMVGKFSADRGRTWSETRALQTVDGQGIAVGNIAGHHSLLHLQSGKLGLVYGVPRARPGRDGTVCFRTSSDDGKTWSDLIHIDPRFAVSRNQSARVLSTGRILVPVMKWISPYTGRESEMESNNLCYSWVYYSDDEGEIWQASHSELLIIKEQGKAGCYNVEEPVVEELKDGTVLFYDRTEFGRPYESFSRDGGISWTALRPVELASGYSPHTFARIASTGDLLLVWNQVSGKESVSGLQRHRLSTAISEDDGKTWKHFRNLESLDNRTRIQPPRDRLGSIGRTAKNSRPTTAATRTPRAFCGFATPRWS